MSESNTFILPSHNAGLDQGRREHNSSLRALLRNFYGPLAPTSSNFEEENANFNPPDGVLWYKSNEGGVLNVVDSTNKKNQPFGTNITGHGVRFRNVDSEALLEANNANNHYEIGETISLVSADSQLTNPGLFLKTANTGTSADLKRLGGGDIVARSVDADKMADNAVITRVIQDGAVTTVKIEDGAVGTDQIEDGAVGTDQIEDEAITDEKVLEISGSKLLANSLPGTVIGSGTVTPDKISISGTGANNQVLASTGAGGFKWIDQPGGAQQRTDGVSNVITLSDTPDYFTLMLHDLVGNNTGTDFLIRVGLNSAIASTGYAMSDKYGNREQDNEYSTTNIPVYRTGGEASNKTTGILNFTKISSTVWVVTGTMVTIRNENSRIHIISGYITHGNINKVQLYNVTSGSAAIYS